MQPFSYFTPNAMDLCDLSSHHVVDKEVLSLSRQYHLLPVPAKVGRGDGETLNVHTLKFRIHLTIHLNRNYMKITQLRKTGRLPIQKTLFKAACLPNKNVNDSQK